MGGACNMYEGEVHTGFLWGKLMERVHLEEPGINGKIILKRIFRNVLGARIGFMWLRVGTGGGFL